VPYLKKALSEANRQITRLEAAFQLIHLRVPAGFQYIYRTALLDPEPEGKLEQPVGVVYETRKEDVGIVRADVVAIRLSKSNDVQE